MSRLPELGPAPQAEDPSCTHRPLSTSFLGLPYRVLNNISHKEELLRGLWVLSLSLGYRVSQASLIQYAVFLKFGAPCAGVLSSNEATM